MINFADEPTVKDYLRSCKRHWWITAIVLLVAAGIGFQQAFLVKPSYKATATVAADTSTTNTKDYVDKITVPEVARVVELLSAQVLSQENLLKIAKENSLFPQAAAKGDEKLAAAMRSAVGTEVNGFDTFAVSFVYGDATTAAKVANQLAGQYLEAIRSDREANGAATNQILATELATYAKQLRDQEESMRQFKVAHQGALPGQTEGNIRAIEKWQTDLEVNLQNLEKAKQQLALSTQNTPKLFQGPEIDQMRAAVAGYQAEREELKKLIAHNQALVAQSGDVEGKLAEQQREYNVTLATYNDLLKRRQDAAIRVDLDRSRFAQLFKVMQPAKVPAAPFRPIRQLVLAIALAAGLILGLAGAVVRDYFDETFRDPAELARHTGLPVLASVPSQGRILPGKVHQLPS
jgi:uncharacterized protein involved in exopolysaccharide biosynthesis